jgi:hypothetical protein
MKKYYYSNGVDRKGPVTLEELKLVGDLRHDTLVWYEGLTGWVRAGELEELIDISFSTVPPPPPPLVGGKAGFVMSSWSANPRVKQICVFGLAVMLAVVSTLFAIKYSGNSQTKTDDILKLIKVTNTAQEIERVINLSLKENIILNADAYIAKWKEKANYNDLSYELVPLYDKYYTHDEIKQLIKFYESPLGKRVLEITPLLSTEAGEIGEEWGKKLAAEVFDDLMKERGY